VQSSDGLKFIDRRTSRKRAIDLDGRHLPQCDYADHTLYGHGSSIALVVFIGLFAMRALSSHRRRRGPHRSSPAASSFTDPNSPSRAPGPADTPSGQVPFTGIAPGWLVDPSRRHEQRYWSGSEWTEHVMDAGVPGTDPPPDGAGRDVPS
jgi:Protein of unknown function (DUF2510)